MIETKQPTQEEIKKFWEWCGFHNDGITGTHGADNGVEYFKPFWYSLTEELYMELPPINLNKLFKYAVSKLERENRYHNIVFGFDRTCPEIKTVQVIFGNNVIGAGESKDPALALFWAIYEIIKEGEKNNERN
jgi:hypothetical protein